MTPLAVLGLLKYIPDVVGLFDKKRGQKAKEAIDVVGSIAEAVTGKSGNEAIKVLEEDTGKALEFQLAVMADARVQDQLELEDIKSAREMYTVNPAQAEKVAQIIMAFNLPIVFLLVIINILVVVYLKDDAVLLAIICNFIGIVLHALLNERQSIIGFYFGSSLGSKLKEQT